MKAWFCLIMKDGGQQVGEAQWIEFAAWLENLRNRDELMCELVGQSLSLVRVESLISPDPIFFPRLTQAKAALLQCRSVVPSSVTVWILSAWIEGALGRRVKAVEMLKDVKNNTLACLLAGAFGVGEWSELC